MRTVFICKEAFAVATNEAGVEITWSHCLMPKTRENCEAKVSELVETGYHRHNIWQTLFKAENTLPPYRPLILQSIKAAVALIPVTKISSSPDFAIKRAIRHKNI